MLLEGRAHHNSFGLGVDGAEKCLSMRARILSATRRQPKDGSTHWSCRKLAAALGVSKDAVHRVWKEAGLKPHRLERYMASDDPEFETKAADIIGLYLNPPQPLRMRTV